MSGYGLPTNLTPSAPISSAVENREHGIINSQLGGILDSRGEGILISRYGSTSFQVTAGTGLQVLVAPGAGVVLGDSLPTSYIERTTQLALTIPASTQSYVWQGLENNPPNNRTEESGLPLTFWSLSPSESNAIPLATVTTSANAVTSITDTRGVPLDRGAAGYAIIGGAAFPITAGAVDSAGTGFRTLRIPNS